MLSVTGTESALTVVPQNTAVVSGSLATLHCSSSFGSQSINWLLGSDVVVAACSPMSVNFSVNTSTSGQCDLIINNVQSSVSGFYQCFEANDFDAEYDGAFLTVIG